MTIVAPPEGARPLRWPCQPQRC